MRVVLAIVGPTASGKTNLAGSIARKLKGEIISADSRQVYKHVSISTACPDKILLKKIRHYFIDELKPDEEFNAGEFGKKGRQIIDKIFEEGKQPLIVGGSGLYIRSLIDGFFEDEIKSKKIREELNEELNLYGKKYLYEKLKRLDIASSEKMTAENSRRVIRAIEVYLLTGKKISELQQNNAQINFKTIQFGLRLDRKVLYDRINNRVDQMFKDGLLKEVGKLKEMGFDYKKNNSLNTVGIKEVYKFTEGEFDFETMTELIKRNTRRYAKRQLTWFNKDKRIHWIDVTKDSAVENLSDKIISEFLKHPVEN